MQQDGLGPDGSLGLFKHQHLLSCLDLTFMALLTVQVFVYRLAPPTSNVPSVSVDMELACRGSCNKADEEAKCSKKYQYLMYQTMPKIVFSNE
jgi:hypothetical protein